MNGNYLFDTNSTLYYLQGREDWIEFIDALPVKHRFASVVTRMELLAYPGIEPNEENGIRSFLSDVAVIPLTEEIETMTIAIRRHTRIKLPDAVIVATAIVLDASLLTSDQQLVNLEWPGLTVVNPSKN